MKAIKNIAVFGGEINTLNALVKEAKNRKYGVHLQTDLVSETFDTEGVKVFKTNYHDSNAIDQVLNNTQCVILLTENKPNRLPYSKITEKIVTGMKWNKISRIIAQGGIGLTSTEDNPSISDKIIIKVLSFIGHRMAKDSLKAAKILEDSGLEWTIARTSILNNELGVNEYRVGMLGSLSINSPLTRTDFVKFLLDCIKSVDYVNRIPIVTGPGMAQSR